MTIAGITREQLFEILNRELSVSHPIRSPEHLFGRERDLDRIHNALEMHGRQVFIYGDRGVGKTSLGQTAAYRFQSANAMPVLTSCEEDSTFESVIQDVLIKLRSDTPYQSKRTIEKKTGIRIDISSKALAIGRLAENAEKTEENLLPSIRDANAAATLLRIDGVKHSERPIVLIDEFDRMKSVKERYKFADLLKQLGDQEVPVKFIFCGIADSLDDLLEGHGSAYRYLEGIKVERMDYSARFDIIDKSSSALGLEVEDGVRLRIAAISDGFPYYIHLICEKLYINVFDVDDLIECVVPKQFQEAVEASIQSIEHSIKKPYERILLRPDSDDLEPVLWAVADHSDLQRLQTSIYQSYCSIMGRCQRKPVSEKEFTPLMARLRSDSCRVIQLHKGRRGVNEFCENIFRGYVRLRAEMHGVSLDMDYAPAADPKRITVGKVVNGVSPLYQRPTFGRNGSR